jgi:hypothetical protein
MPISVHLWGTRLRRTNGGTAGARGGSVEVDVPADERGEAARRPGRGKAVTAGETPIESLDRTEDAGGPIASPEAESMAAAEVSR